MDINITHTAYTMANMILYIQTWEHMLLQLREIKKRN
jgi:hypothetical protein